MTVAGDIARDIEVIEIDELFSDRMKVRCDCPTIVYQRGVSIADRQVAQDLIISSIFFDDVDHMFDPLLKLMYQGGILPAELGIEMVVLYYLSC